MATARGAREGDERGGGRGSGGGGLPGRRPGGDETESKKGEGGNEDVAL